MAVFMNQFCAIITFDLANTGWLSNKNIKLQRNLGIWSKFQVPVSAGSLTIFFAKILMWLFIRKIANFQPTLFNATLPQIIVIDRHLLVTLSLREPRHWSQLIIKKFQQTKDGLARLADLIESAADKKLSSESRRPDKSTVACTLPLRHADNKLRTKTGTFLDRKIPIVLQ